jgi:hypothetical protein
MYVPAWLILRLQEVCLLDHLDKILNVRNSDIVLFMSFDFCCFFYRCKCNSFVHLLAPSWTVFISNCRRSKPHVECSSEGTTEPTVLASLCTHLKPAQSPEPNGHYEICVKVCFFTIFVFDNSCHQCQIVQYQAYDMPPSPQFQVSQFQLTGKLW